MKCPQLSKPEVTAARNQNSIGDRMEKKTLGETRLSRGAISPLAREYTLLSVHSEYGMDPSTHYFVLEIFIFYALSMSIALVFIYLNVSLIHIHCNCS